MRPHASSGAADPHVLIMLLDLFLPVRQLFFMQQMGFAQCEDVDLSCGHRTKQLSLLVIREPLNVPAAGLHRDGRSIMIGSLMSERSVWLTILGRV